jgi:hypothetical protein
MRSTPLLLTFFHLVTQLIIVPVRVYPLTCACEDLIPMTYSRYGRSLARTTRKFIAGASTVVTLDGRYLQYRRPTFLEIGSIPDAWRMYTASLTITLLPGNWTCSHPFTVNLAPFGCSHIRSFSLRTTPLRIVFLNAQPSVIPRRVWSLATNAVCNLPFPIYNST